MDGPPLEMNEFGSGGLGIMWVREKIDWRGPRGVGVLRATCGCMWLWELDIFLAFSFRGRWDDSILLSHPKREYRTTKVARRGKMGSRSSSSDIFLCFFGPCLFSSQRSSCKSTKNSPCLFSSQLSFCKSTKNFSFWCHRVDLSKMQALKNYLEVRTQTRELLNWMWFDDGARNFTMTFRKITKHQWLFCLINKRTKPWCSNVIDFLLYTFFLYQLWCFRYKSSLVVSVEPMNSWVFLSALRLYG